MDILIVIGIAAGLSLIFALLILLVSKFCAVKEDERVAKVLEHLAGANCGGCGYAGCEGFAKALAEGKAPLSGCGPTSNAEKEEIARILGIEFVGSEPAYAVVKCAGGELALNKYEFVGNEGCISQNAYIDGKKVCKNGCIACRKCERLCPNDAIHVKDNHASVDHEKCTKCGACVEGCPTHCIHRLG